jgi:hypothetical protein
MSREQRKAPNRPVAKGRKTFLLGLSHRSPIVAVVRHPRRQERAVRYRRIYAKANRDGSTSVVSAGPVGAAAILTLRSVVGRFLAIGIAFCFINPFPKTSQAFVWWAIVWAAVLTIADAIWRLDRRQRVQQAAGVDSRSS